jgi:hypothetical protein
MVYYIQSPIPPDLELDMDECTDECANDANTMLVDVTPDVKFPSSK